MAGRMPSFLYHIYTWAKGPKKGKFLPHWTFHLFQIKAKLLWEIVYEIGWIMKFALIWNTISYWHSPSGCLGINVRIIYDSAFPHSSCPWDRAWTEEKERNGWLHSLDWEETAPAGGRGTGFTGAKLGANPDLGMDQFSDLETAVYNRGQPTFSVNNS